MPSQRPAEPGPLDPGQEAPGQVLAHFQAEAAVNGTAAAVPLRLFHVASPFNLYVPNPLRLRRWHLCCRTTIAVLATAQRVLSCYYLRQQDVDCFGRVCLELDPPFIPE